MEDGKWKMEDGKCFRCEALGGGDSPHFALCILREGIEQDVVRRAKTIMDAGSGV
jgi:hypothetical protein